MSDCPLFERSSILSRLELLESKGANMRACLGSGFDNVQASTLYLIKLCTAFCFVHECKLMEQRWCFLRITVVPGHPPLGERLEGTVHDLFFLYIYLNYNFFFPLSEKACAEAGSARMSLLILVSIFLSAAFVMFLVYKNFPQLSE